MLKEKKMRSHIRIISAIVFTCLLSTTALAAEWQRITDPPAAPQNMLLLTNGDVMTLTSDRGPNAGMPDRSQVWMRLSPDTQGDYSNGSWRFTAPMSIPRLFFASNIVRDTRLIVLGGEYSGIGLPPNWTRTGEAYDPAADTWQAIAPHPEPQFGDDPTMLLDGDRIFAGSLSTRNTWIYHYPTDTWEQTPIPKVYNDRSDEETWVKLPGGRILNYDLFQSLAVPNGQFAEIFDPVANEWLPASPTDGTAAGFIPQLSSTTLGFELGGALQKPQRLRHRNGTEEIFYLGATGHTALYNPARNEWRAGPDILGEADGVKGLFGTDDAPAAELPNGHIIFTADAGPLRGTFSPPTRVFLFDPESNIISQLSTPFDARLNTIPAYETRLLVLPTGQILYGDMVSTEMWAFTADGTAPRALQPKVDDVVLGPAWSNSFTVIGRQLNGASAGSSYGDDVESDENYPIVSLTAKDGSVFYATTSNWSNTDVGKKGAQTVDFTLPKGMPADKYKLVVSGAGIQSKPFCVKFTADQVRAAPTNVSISCQDKDDENDMKIANK
jgi:hypothetical protein